VLDRGREGHKPGAGVHQVDDLAGPLDGALDEGGQFAVEPNPLRLGDCEAVLADELNVQLHVQDG
jgi:hypothetical protein